MPPPVYLTHRKAKLSILHSVSLGLGLVIKRKTIGHILLTDYL